MSRQISRFKTQPVAVGESDERAPFDGFVLTRTLRQPDSELERHAHMHTNIALCMRGDFRETLHDRWHEIDKCTLLCRPAGEPHANRYGRRPAECLIFEIQPQALEHLRSYTRLLDEPVMLRSELIGGFAGRIGREFRSRDTVRPLALESMLFELVAYASRLESRKSSVKPDWLRRVEELLSDQHMVTPTLRELAHTVDVHPAHLCRVFRQHFHTTIGEFVRERRLNRAFEMLRNSTMSLAEIAVSCGYYDQSHFTGCFTRRFGIPPARFRALRTVPGRDE